MVRIFLCDDEAEYRHLVKAVLHAEPDFRVIGEAEDAEACLRILPLVAPDLVLLDINMPRTDGWHVLAALREVAPDVRVIVLSSAPGLEREATSRGAFGYIQKPLDAFELPALVRARLDG